MHAFPLRLIFRRVLAPVLAILLAGILPACARPSPGSGCHTVEQTLEIPASGKANAVLALAGSPEARCIVRLRVVGNPPGDEGLALLCRAPLPALHDLYLDAAGLGMKSLSMLSDCAWWPRLQRLSLTRNRFEGGDGQESTAQGTAPRLVFLDLSLSHCRLPCLAALQRAGALDALRHLRLEGAFGPRELRFLAGLPLPRLEVLELHGIADLSEDPADVAGDEGMEILAASGMLARLRCLALTLHGIGDDGATKLAAARADRLQVLDLRGNLITDRGAAALRDSPYIGQLDSLGLVDNPASRPLPPLSPVPMRRGPCEVAEE